MTCSMLNLLTTLVSNCAAELGNNKWRVEGDKSPVTGTLGWIIEVVVSKRNGEFSRVSSFIARTHRYALRLQL